MTPGANSKVWLDYDQDALNDQYEQRVLVPDAADYLAHHARKSARVRATLECRLERGCDHRSAFGAGKAAAAVVVINNHPHQNRWTIGRPNGLTRILDQTLHPAAVVTQADS